MFTIPRKMGGLWLCYTHIIFHHHSSLLIIIDHYYHLLSTIMNHHSPSFTIVYPYYTHIIPRFYPYDIHDICIFNAESIGSLTSIELPSSTTAALQENPPKRWPRTWWRFYRPQRGGVGVGKAIPNLGGSWGGWVSWTSIPNMIWFRYDLDVRLIPDWKLEEFLRKWCLRDMLQGRRSLSLSIYKENFIMFQNLRGFWFPQQKRF